MNCRFYSDEVQLFYRQLESLCSRKKLPSHDEISILLEQTVSVLEREITGYREADSNGECGGLLDFTTEEYKGCSVIIVPDIHARKEFLLKLMKFSVDGKSVLEGLFEKQMIVVCVGDGVHSEVKGFERWCAAYNKWLHGNLCCREMREELLDDAVTMMCVWMLKCRFPENFHFLKGNHENIMNAEGGGNHAFRKFVQEGMMTYDAVRNYYGDDIIMYIRMFENLLPVCAVTSSAGITHAEPRRAWKREEIIDFRNNPDLILDFTWTPNEDSDTERNSVSVMFRNLIKADRRILWFGGHRPVHGKYFLRQNGTFIQFHNPEEMNVAVLVPGKSNEPGNIIFPVQDNCSAGRYSSGS